MHKGKKLLVLAMAVLMMALASCATEKPAPQPEPQPEVTTTAALPPPAQAPVVAVDQRAVVAVAGAVVGDTAFGFVKTPPAYQAVVETHGRGGRSCAGGCGRQERGQ